MTTTAKIAAKGTKGTGITEQLAAALHDNLGKTVLAVVELRSESRGENLKGDETVHLAIQTLEVIPEDVGAAEHVRELAKVAHYNRKLAEDGPKLPVPGDDIEPKVADVLAAGAALAPHVYLPVQEDDNEVCDICGDDEDDPRHAADLLDPEHTEEEHEDLAHQHPDEEEPPADDDPTVREPVSIGSPFDTP